MLVLALFWFGPPPVKAQTPFHDIRPGKGVTKVGWLSDYHPPLRGTPGDTRVYTLDSGRPGGTAVIVAGTHGNEIAGIIAAAVFVERAKPTAGRLIVVPHANNANTDYQDGTFSGAPEFIVITTDQGVPRTFRYGSRRTNPLYETKPDPVVYERPDGEAHEGFEIRNLNRVHPGVPDGSLTEQIAYGLLQLLLREGADVAMDLHEAHVDSPIANTVVAHQRALETAAVAVLDLSAQGLHFNLEPSRQEFRGLSHREWGDHTPALALLTETPNPGQSDENPFPDIVAHPDYPLHDRVGRQLALVRAVLDAATELSLMEPVHYRGVPDYAEMVTTGLGPWLNGDGDDSKTPARKGSRGPTRPAGSTESAPFGPFIASESSSVAAPACRNQASRPNVPSLPSS